MARTYTMTAASVLTKARTLISDNRQDMGYRTSDAQLIASLNEALGAMLGINPGLFSRTDFMSCVAGYLQTLDFPRAVMLLDLPGLNECDAVSLTQFMPGWRTATAGTAQNWMRSPGDPLKFALYPPAVGGAQVEVRHVRAHAALSSLADVVEVPENYEPALVEYVAGRADLQDDEHANSGRASALLERFAANIKALAGA